jgi:hypothetical protein
VNLKRKDFALFIFWMLILCSVLALVSISLTSVYNIESDIAIIPVQVIIALFTALLAGVFTIVGVDRSLKKQNESSFVKEFPLKIFYLEQLINSLEEIKSKLTLEKGQFLVLEENFLQSLFTISTEIDGYIYFQVRKAHETFSRKIRGMFHDEGQKLLSRDNWGQWVEVEEKEIEIEKSINELNEIINDLIRTSKSYHEDFVNHYNNNVAGSIYKRINS